MVKIYLVLCLIHSWLLNLMNKKLRLSRRMFLKQTKRICFHFHLYFYFNQKQPSNYIQNINKCNVIVSFVVSHFKTIKSESITSWFRKQYLLWRKNVSLCFIFLLYTERFTKKILCLISPVFEHKNSSELMTNKLLNFQFTQLLNTAWSYKIVSLYCSIIFTIT